MLPPGLLKKRTHLRRDRRECLYVYEVRGEPRLVLAGALGCHGARTGFHGAAPRSFGTGGKADGSAGRGWPTAGLGFGGWGLGREARLRVGGCGFAARRCRRVPG